MYQAPRRSWPQQALEVLIVISRNMNQFDLFTKAVRIVGTGLIRFASDKPCRFGHVGDRYTRDDGCVTCSNLLSAAWSLENKERHKALIAAWMLRNPEKVAASRLRSAPKHRLASKAYYNANKERVGTRIKAWKTKNAEHVAKQRKEYRLLNAVEINAKHRLHYAANSVRICAGIEVWRKANPLRSRSYKHARRSRERLAGGSFTPAQINTMLTLQKSRCANLQGMRQSQIRD